MNKHKLNKNKYMLHDDLAHTGYDWWWHSFTAVSDITCKSKTFFIEYFIINPQRGRDYPVFTNLAGGIKPSYLMVRAGYWGNNGKVFNRYYGINEYDNSTTMLKIATKDAFLSENNIWGNINVTQDDIDNNPTYNNNCGNMSWSLKINKLIPFNAGYATSLPFRISNAFEMYWHAEGMKTNYSGTIVLDGETYTVSPDTCQGYADKNWGTDYTSPWLWLNSCNLTSLISNTKLNNSAFTIGGGCPKVFGIPLNNQLLMKFFYEGDSYEFNFSKFWTLSRTKFRCYETEDAVVWKIKAINNTAAIELKVACKKSEMLFMDYENPIGLRQHKRLWNGGTGIGYIKLYKIVGNKRILVDHMKAKNVGCEYGEFEHHDSL